MSKGGLYISARRFSFAEPGPVGVVDAEGRPLRAGRVVEELEMFSGSSAFQIEDDCRC